MTARASFACASPLSPFERMGWSELKWDALIGCEGEPSRKKKQEVKLNFRIVWLMPPYGGRKGGALKLSFGSHSAHANTIFAQVAFGCAAVTVEKKDECNKAKELVVPLYCLRDSVGFSGGTLQQFCLVHLNQRGRTQRDNHLAKQSRYNIDSAYRMRKPLYIPHTTFW